MSIANTFLPVTHGVPLLWFQRNSVWERRDVDQPVLDLSPFWRSSSDVEEEPTSRDSSPWGRLLVVPRGEGTAAFFLVGSAAMRVNGYPLQTGLKALAPRDEIRWAEKTPVYFALDTTPVVQPMPDVGRPVPCARCRGPIVPGQAAARCANPDCGLWYHQGAERQCLTYTSECCVCGHATHGAALVWAPEELP